MTLTEFHIGIDDTDSDSGGCTTHSAAVLFDELTNLGLPPSDFPWLVRLNPNVPWKTRGNGALSIHLNIEESHIQKVQRTSLKTVRATSNLHSKRSDPAVVFLRGPVPQKIREFSRAALHDVLSIAEARRVAEAAGVQVHLLKGFRGLIGSLAAIGASLDAVDHTFEIIAYRTQDNLGKTRRVDLDSVRQMDSNNDGKTFHNLDHENGRVLVCPHGPDPVLLGIRGISPQAVRQAFCEVRILEPIERTMIFKTNQGTDAHLTEERQVVKLARFQSTIVTGRVETVPKILRGGHVIFELSDETGSIECAAYAPTSSLRTAARDLLPGDRVKAYGGVRQMQDGRLTLNLEKMEVLSLVKKYFERNPTCTSCGARCESMGHGQGYRCKECGMRDSEFTKTCIPLERKIQPTTYVPVVRARRHLTRPDPAFN